MSSTSSDEVRELERHVHQRAHRTRLTIAEICADLAVSRSTFYEWRVEGRAPPLSSYPTVISVSVGPNTSAG